MSHVTTRSKASGLKPLTLVQNSATSARYQSPSIGSIYADPQGTSSAPPPEPVTVNLINVEAPPEPPQPNNIIPNGNPDPGDDGDGSGDDDNNGGGGDGSDGGPPTPEPRLPDPEAPDDLEGLSLRDILLLLGRGMRGQVAPAPVVLPPPPRRVKVNPPDEFDGRDPKKLRSYLVSCNLVFRADPNSFATSDKKVNYALSFLRGSAQRHFDSQLEDEEELDFIPPDWLNDWSVFVRELKKMFGDPNAEANAESELSSLRMRNNQKFTDFLVEFNSVAVQVKWNTDAIRYQLRTALPARIKEVLALVEEPRDLDAFKATVQSIDRRYWERQSESRRGLHPAQPQPQPPSTYAQRNSPNPPPRPFIPAN